MAAIPPNPLMPGIPAFTLSGTLPPYVGTPTVGTQMSPYRATLLEIAQRFCHTPHRCDMLRGLIDLKRQIANAGVVDGFLWLAGSFLEEIEKLEARNPNDIDVVLFLRRPAAH